MADRKITRVLCILWIPVLILHGVGEAAVWLENVECDSYPEVIATDPAGFRYQPVYIQLNRCKGASIAGPHHLMSCQPAVQKQIELQVFDPNSMELATLHMRNETECVYKCVANATVCTGNEVWVEDLCECECRYHRDTPPQPPPCPEGQHWEFSTCACVDDFLLKHSGVANGNETVVERNGTETKGIGHEDEDEKVISITVKEAPIVP